MALLLLLPDAAPVFGTKPIKPKTFPSVSPFWVTYVWLVEALLLVELLLEFDAVVAVGVAVPAEAAVVAWGVAVELAVLLVVEPLLELPLAGKLTLTPAGKVTV